MTKDEAKAILEDWLSSPFHEPPIKDCVVIRIRDGNSVEDFTYNYLLKIANS